MEYLRTSKIVFGILIAMVAGHLCGKLSDELDKIKEGYNECSKNYTITNEMKSEMLTGKLPEDDCFKCFFKCIFDQVPSLNTNKDSYSETVLSLIPSFTSNDTIIHQVGTCAQKKVQGPDTCDASYDFLVCILKVYPKFLTLVIN